MDLAPLTEYVRRRDARREEAARRARADARLAGARLAVFAAGAVLVWLSIGRGRISPAWLALPAAAFLALAILHDRVLRAKARAGRAAAFYERGIDRIEDRWTGDGAAGTRFLDGSHLYAEDLDLFGEGSLFQFLSRAQTRAGEAALAAWLLAPADPPEIRGRQEAVAELRSRLDFREEMAVAGEEGAGGPDTEALAAWSAGPPLLRAGPLRAAAPALAAAAVVAGAVFLATGAGGGAAALLLAAEAAFAAALRPRVRRVLAGAGPAARELAVLAAILRRIEREPLACPRLARIRAALATSGLPASRAVARLSLLMALLDSRRNQLFAPVAALTMWGTQIAFALEGWRRRHGPSVARWLEAAGDVEALASLAAYAFERPGDPFPEIVEGGPLLEAEGLGHPLLPEEKTRRNDVALGGGLRVLIVSGSNMSGKSTLLRSVGTAAVMAQAGAPVRARRLRLSPLAIGATIRIHDSLQAGTSRFYAEITRLRRIVDLTSGPRPVLFLLDELLHGTNSRDRRAGGAAVVRGLVDRGAAGLLTTHDLALAEIEEGLDGRAANVHFEDHLEGGRIAFDYMLCPGVVTRSNALPLMRAVGLDV
jgi:hypothetical protein